MSITHDLSRLADLHRSGDLSDTEYKQAKARVQSEHTLSGHPSLARVLKGLSRSQSDRWMGGVC